MKSNFEYLHERELTEIDYHSYRWREEKAIQKTISKIIMIWIVLFFLFVPFLITSIPKS